MLEYFFKNEVSDSKSFQGFIERYEIPKVIASAASLMSIDVDELRSVISGDTVNSSFAGSIMLSKLYLKSFYSQHAPEFASSRTT
jgi:hypothetical protein